MVTKKQLIKLSIEQSIDNHQKARVYFTSSTRSPLFGKFVRLADAKDLASKGMVRFVMDYKVDEFEETKHVMFTRIFVIEAFSDIKVF